VTGRMPAPLLTNDPPAGAQVSGTVVEPSAPVPPPPLDSVAPVKAPPSAAPPLTPPARPRPPR
jgi:hypothetical protein